MARNALGQEFGSATRLSKRSCSVWNCLWGHTLKISPGIIRKSRVSYPAPEFISSATWLSLPKKYYNGLILIHLIVISKPATTPFGNPPPPYTGTGFSYMLSLARRGIFILVFTRMSYVLCLLKLLR